MRNILQNKSILIFVTLLILFSLPFQAFSHEQEVDDGLAWLMDKQDSDKGTWGTDPIRETGLTVEVLSELDEDIPPGALDFLRQTEPDAIDYLTRKIISLAAAGDNTTADINTLLSLQNTDGGFGFRKGYPSSLIDTLLAGKAFAKSSITTGDAVGRLIYYITDNQNPDKGSFGYVDEDNGSLYLTCLAVTVLEHFMPTYDLASYIENALSYIWTKGAPDNASRGFGENESTSLETAVAIQALIAGGNNAGEINNASNFLVESQDEYNKSWDNDTYTTAHVLRSLNLVTKIDLPNLAVTDESISVSPAYPVSGENVTISCTIENNGAVVAQNSNGNVLVAFYLGEVLEENRIGTAEIDPISVSGEGYAEMSFVLEGDAGREKIYVVADPDRDPNLEIVEINEDDNIGSYSFTSGTQPDLYISADDIVFDNTAPIANEPFNMKATIYNLGETGSGLFTVSVYKGEPLDNNTSPGDLVLSGIDGGSYGTVSFQLALSEGTEDIYIKIDNSGDGNEDNNIAYKSITVRSPDFNGLDLSVTESGITYAPLFPNDNENVSVYVKIRNSGDIDATNVPVKVYDIGPSGETTLIEDTIEIIYSGQEITLLDNSTFEAGNHVIRVELALDETISEITKINNTAQKSFTVVEENKKPDVEILPILIEPANPEIGEPVTITCGSKNSGEITLSNIKLKVYDGNPDSGAPLLVPEITIPSLEPGSSANINIVKETDLWGGTHELWTVVDPDNAITGEDEANNKTENTVEVPVHDGVDLAVAGSGLFTEPAILISGDTAVLKCEITNTGTETAAMVPVSFYIDGQAYDNEIITEIQVGQNVFAEVELNTSAYGGTHTVLVIIDPDKEIDETNEFNNSVSKDINISASDLSVTPSDISFSEHNPSPGQTVTLQAVVHNEGDQPSGPFKVVFYNGTPETGSVIGEDNMTALVNDNSTVAEIDFSVPQSSSLNMITVVADADNETAESNEENNTAYRYLNVNSEWTDLSIDRYDVSVTPDYPSAYETINLLVRVRNKGTTIISGASVSIYSEPNGTGDLLVPVIPIDNILPGQTQTISAEFNLGQGGHEISILAESGGASESDTDNNLVNRSISVRENILFYNNCGSDDKDTERIQGMSAEITGVDPDNNDEDISASTDKTSVQYEYDGLDPDTKYEVIVSYLQETGGGKIQSLSSDNVTIHGPRSLPEGKAEIFVFDIPQETYADGEIILSFDNESAQDVLVSRIYIAEKYEQYPESIARGVNWLASYQNSTGGWPSYDVTVDTASLLRALVLLDRPEHEEWRRLLYKRLLELQGTNGSWGNLDETSLAVIALIEAGMDKDSPEIVSAKIQLRNYITGADNLNPDYWYHVKVLSMAIVALITAGDAPDAPDILYAANWLKEKQDSSGYWSESATYGTYVGPFAVIALQMTMPDVGASAQISNAINYWSDSTYETSPQFLKNRLEVYISDPDPISVTREDKIIETVDALIACQGPDDGAWTALKRNDKRMSEPGTTSDIVRVFNEIKDRCSSFIDSPDIDNATEAALPFLKERTTEAGDVSSLYDRTEDTALAAWFMSLYGYEDPDLKIKIKNTVDRILDCQHEPGDGWWTWNLIPQSSSTYAGQNRPNAFVSSALHDIPYQPGDRDEAYDRSIFFLFAKQSMEYSPELQKNVYIGWYAGSSGTPDILNTCWVINSLAKARGDNIQYFEEAQFRSGLEWLLGYQQADGSFADATYSGSFITGLALTTLANLDNDTKTAHGIDDIMTSAADYLLEEQKDDGSWGNVNTTALALVGLSTLGINGPEVNRGVNYLMAVQNNDGGWNKVAGSPQSETRSTTYVSWALYVSDYKQDIEVDLQFSKPWYLPGDEVKMTVSVGDYDINDLEINGTFSQFGGDTDNLTFTGNEASFILSSDHEPGTDTVIITVKDSDNRTGMVSGSIPVLAGYSGIPDLQITSESISVSNTAPDVGEPIIITAFIENTSIYDAADVKVECYTMHPDAGGTPIDVPQTIERIGGFDTATAEFLWPAVPGSHEIYVVIDPDETVDEISDENNAAYLPLFVGDGLSLPDIMVTEPLISFSPSEPQEGETVIIKAQVFNVGENDVYDVIVSFYNSTEQISDNQTIQYIAAGDNETAQISWDTMGYEGLNYIHVVANTEEEEINQYNNEAVKTILVGEPEYADFAVSSAGISFQPELPDEGDIITVSALIENFGDPAGGVKVALYNGDPEEGGELKGESVIYETIGFGESKAVDFQVDSAGMAGTNEIFIQVNSDNVVAEENKENNLASEIVTISSSGLQIIVSLDEDSYEADQPVSITTDIENFSPENRTLNLDIQLLDSAGNVAEDISIGKDIALTPSEELEETLLWNTGSIKAGEYRITAILYEAGTKKTQDVQGFLITADESLSAEVTTDKIAYYSYDQVRIQSEIKSLSENYTFSDLQVDIIVKDASGTIIDDTEGQDVEYIENLFPLENRLITSYWNTQDKSPGLYTVILNVDDGEVNMGNDNSSINILPSYDAGEGLQGEIVANSSTVHRGDEISFEYEVLNTGNSYIDDLSLIVQIMDAATKENIQADTYNCSIDINAVCGSTTAFQTSDMEPGDAIAVLLGVIDGVTQTFAFTPFSITNQCPVADAGLDQFVYIDEEAFLSGSLSSDPDNDTLTYSWEIIRPLPEGSGAALSDNDTETTSITADVHGDYKIALTVSDGICTSEQDIVIVTTDNRAPIAEAGENQTAFIGDTVQLDGSGSYDPDNDTVETWFWILFPPSGSDASLSDPNLVDPVFIPDMHGAYRAQLIVTSNGLVSEPDTVKIITQNKIPVADAGENKIVAVNDTVQLDGSSSYDPDGDEISFQWSFDQKPIGSVCELDNNTAVNSVFIPDITGDYVVRLTVTDIFGLEDEAVIRVQADGGSEVNLTDLLESAMLLEWEAIELLTCGNSVQIASAKITSSITALNEIIDRIYSDDHSEPRQRLELTGAVYHLEMAVRFDDLALNRLYMNTFWNRLLAIYYIDSAIVFKHAAMIIINGYCGICDE